MKDLSVFERFAKSSKNQFKVDGTNAVIYTRVSSKEQEENLSLGTQMKACKAFAEKLEYQVLSYFGGKYESAKTDERKEFNRMLQFIKKNKQKVSYIIVYSLDRFSRTGPNAIYIASELKKQGVMILSVTQPTDTSTASGTLHQNIQFLFSQYDNDQRREKCVAGMRERLLQGEAVHQSPMGYDHIYENGQRRIVVNDTGKLIRKAFYWKANQQLSNMEIIQKLKALGLNLYPQQLNKIFNNPYYCGILTNRVLEGKMVEGKHEKVVPTEIFLKAHNLQKENLHGYTHKDEMPDIPLKHFLKCNTCGKFLTGYVVKKKNIHYYKCRTVGCGCNHSAKQLNNQFKEILSKFSFEEKYENMIKYTLEQVYNKFNEGNKDIIITLKKNLTEVETKIEKLEEKYIMEEVDKALYQKFSAKYKQEKMEIQKVFDEVSTKSSNLHEFIEYTLSISLKLDAYWENLDFKTKQKLQYLVFPEGIYFDKKTGAVRTEKVNSVFDLINCFSEELKKNKKGKIKNNFDLSPLVDFSVTMSNSFIEDIKLLSELSKCIPMI